MIEITPEYVCSPFSQSRSEIESTQIDLNKVKKPVRYENIILGMGNIPVIENNSRFLFKTNIE